MTYQTDRVRNATKREQVFALCNWECVYCFQNLRALQEKLRTVDHIQVRSTGQTDNSISNMLASCHSCNSRRGKKLLHNFLDHETLIRFIRDYPHAAKTIVACIGR